MSEYCIGCANYSECERRVMFSKLRLIGDVDIDAEDWHKPFCRDWQYVLEEQRVSVRLCRG